ncbi:hypothetical protein [Endozoicomonas ascidiicola]|uniref:hypothetical protein n=1 Tax=Endozoicomonas ascidiicola TaxID=1698521 RepID=UPI0008377073|nr:hypothetical protein [Endozoicomonas ascidiicola]
MELEIEVLNGIRQGLRFSLPLSVQGVIAPASMPYVLETEALAFFARVDRDCESVSLSLGERTLSFTQGRHSESREFELFPAYRENGLREALLFNFFGVARFTLEIQSADEVERLESGPLEVLARARTAHQAETMVNFILDETESDLAEATSATRFQSAAANTGDQLNQVVERLQEHTRVLEEISPHILARPLRALSSEMSLSSGSQAEIQSDQGVSWLMENLSVLEEVDDKNQAHLMVDERCYFASEVLSPVVREHTDIYENRVLLGYLDNLLVCTQSLLEDYAPAELSQLRNFHEGYVSFFACMEAWIHQINLQQLEVIRECQRRIIFIRQQFLQKLPVREGDRSLPRITAKVRGHRDYLTLFRMITDWYQSNGFDNTAKQCFLAINSMPDLFEYYSLLRVRRWFSQNEQAETLETVGHSQWRTWLNGFELTLSYEPIFWMVGNSRAGHLVNTENRSVYEAKNNWLGRVRDYEFSRRSPDITIEVKQHGQTLGLIVMDAKYTTRDQAFKHYLAECTMKYVHGIDRAASSAGDGSLVKAMIILYADFEDEFLDFHAAPYDVYGTHAQMPVLGAQSLALDVSEQSGGRSLEMLLSRLLSLFSTSKTSDAFR